MSTKFIIIVIYLPRGKWSISSERIWAYVISGQKGVLFVDFLRPLRGFSTFRRSPRIGAKPYAPSSRSWMQGEENLAASGISGWNCR